MAQIIEFKPKPSQRMALPDVSGRVTEIMYAITLLDCATLNTTYYRFDSRWHQGCRTWSVDGVDVDREDFEEHLSEWLRDRAMSRVWRESATVVPMMTGLS